MHNYESALKHLPPGWNMHAFGAEDAEKTWVVYIMPYVEEGNAANLNTGVFGFSGTNVALLATQLPSFMVCPSNGPVPLFDNSPTWANFVNARGNYAGNNGFGPMTENSPDENKLPRPHGGQPGVLYMNSNLKLSKIADGTSKTALVGEIITVEDRNDHRGVMYYPEGAFYHHGRVTNGTLPNATLTAILPNTSAQDRIRNPWCFNLRPRRRALPSFNFGTSGRWSWRPAAIILAASTCSRVTAVSTRLAIPSNPTSGWALARQPAESRSRAICSKTEWQMYKPWCWSKVAAIAICLALSSGCAPAVRVVEGKVTLDGKALASGAIEFEPADSIAEDFLAGTLRRGVIASKSRRRKPKEHQSSASCRRSRPAERFPRDRPLRAGAMIDEIAEAVPAQYNTRSTLKVDLSTASPHNFELFSHPKSDSGARPARN